MKEKHVLNSTDTLFLFYKNHFYKNVEAEICPDIEENVWAKIRTSSGSAKLNVLL